MRGLIKWFVDNPVAVNLLMMVLIVGGLVSLAGLREEELPQTDLNYITVTVPFLGATPEEVEQGVCVRIEEAVEGTEGILEMTSTASEGSCSVNLELETGADVMRTLNDVKGKVDAINTFPADTEKPVVSQLTQVSEVSKLVLSGNTDERSLKVLALQMRDELAAIDGISQVSVEYVRPDEISVEVSETTLRRYGLTLDAVANAIRTSSLDLPGGAIKSAGGEILVRTQGQHYRGREFEDIDVITRQDGTTVKLGDIANVIDGFEEGDLRVRFNGKPAAMVNVYRVGNEDTIEVSKKVGAYIKKARALLPDGIDLTIWSDSATELAARLNILLGTALSGLAMVLLTLALPLRFRLAMWVAAGIPVAMLGTIMTFGFFDVTMSTLTVMAFILVLGIIVDDAIVVGERIYAHERHNEDQRTAAVNGTDEVAIPVIFGVLTTVAAFFPIIFVPGQTGKFFSVIGVVVCLCLVFSLIECMLILPSHLAHRRRARDSKHGRLMEHWLRFQNRLAQGLENFAEHRYGEWLKRALPWRYTILAAGVGVLLVSVGLVLGGRVNFQFMPPIEGNTIRASLTMPEGIDVEDTARAADTIERAADDLIAELKEKYPDHPDMVRYVLTAIGRSASGGRMIQTSRISPAQSNQAEVSLVLAPSSERGGVATSEISQRWRELTGQIPDAVELTFDSNTFSAGDAISIELRGPDVDDLREIASLVRAELARFDGVTDITDSFRSGKQEAKLSLRPEARVLGITLNDLGRQVRQAFYGAEAQRIQRGSEDIRVMVRYPESERASLGDLEDMRIRTASGVEVPFSSVAHVELGNAYSSIRRVNGQRTITVTADVNRTVTTPEDVLRSMDQKILPELLSGYRGVSYVFSGEQEQSRLSLGGLLRLVPVALLVIYAILAIPLKSYLQPFVIMSVIPFGTVGAMVGHMIMGLPLSITSVLGIVALAGVVVNSSLVMVDYINRQRRLGTELQKAVADAGIVRFRPILLTSITTFVGLLPLMMSRTPETAFIVTMAISLGWGVAFATVVTLFLVPCLYLVLEDFHLWKAPEDAPDVHPSSFANY